MEVPKEKWTWFIFPWNLHEDLRTLLPKTVPQIKKAFREQLHITVPEGHIITTLNDLAKKEIVRKTAKAWEKREP